MTEKKPLPVAEPESVGIPSEAVMKLLNRLEKAKINLHGYLIIRNGKIVSEGYVPPFDRSFRHRLYSVSKSFVSGAVGLLIGEGRLSLEDHVADYFKDLLPEHPDERVMRATVEDLLTMRSPFCWPTYCTDAPRNFVDDWAGSFFNTPCDREPGTSFKYDTSATFILDALVERVTGMPFLDYMKEKIFREIGISDDIWCVKSPDGYSWGGSGVMGTVRELAKYALLFLRGGCWEGKQLIPEWYVKRAVSPIVETHSDTGSHYGYQIWCTRDGSFSFHGMGHQIAVCVPDKDIVFVCCADDQGPDAEEKNAEIYSALFEEVVYAAKDEALPENAASYARLCERNASLKPPVVEGEADSPKALAVNGKTFRMTGIAGGITEMKLSFSDGIGVFEYING
ncbi:MAG: serine hydrolase, partial [Firmicutes bacterium]|nr:serine hydrolase [Bacillota bacterium]